MYPCTPCTSREKAVKMWNERKPLSDPEGSSLADRLEAFFKKEDSAS
jgi:hypothetical protein